MAWLGEAHMCGGIKITLSLKIHTIYTDNANYVNAFVHTELKKIKA